jgi:formylglycine-generating enzyme required for sulfatase activity
MSDIFISYASEDKGRVQALARALEGKGWSVWWDRRIPAGKSFDDVIHEALKAARSVVVVWTKTSVKSTWVKNESRSGLRRNILFPVMLLDEVEIPLEFEHLQAVHLMDWQPEQEHAGFDQFLDDLAGVIGSPSNTVVQPPPVVQATELPPASTKQTPESEAEPLSKNTTEVEPERAVAGPTIATAGAVDSDAPVQSASYMGTTDISGGDRKSAQVNDDRSGQSTGAGQSTESLPYLPIGIGILAAIGALVYFVLFSQGPSPQYQPTVQVPSTRTEVVAPTPVPESVTQASAPRRQERPEVKQGAGSVKTITGKDGAPMVLVPAGEFVMGDEKSGQNVKQPAHPVYLNPFYIDQYEVTTVRYAKFFQETNRPAPEYWSAQVLRQHGRKPVVGVDWNDAVAYCSWAGKRLPTEAEWEKAARGTDQRLYPWGNVNPNATLANFDRCCDFKDYEVLTDVGSSEGGKSPYGAYDMAGNVWEWTADWYDETYYSKSPERNPKGPSSGKYRVLRGGSWLNVPDHVRSANRNWCIPT